MYIKVLIYTALVARCIVESEAVGKTEWSAFTPVGFTGHFVRSHITPLRKHSVQSPRPDLTSSDRDKLRRFNEFITNRPVRGVVDFLTGAVRDLLDYDYVSAIHRINEGGFDYKQTAYPTVADKTWTTPLDAFTDLLYDAPKRAFLGFYYTEEELESMYATDCDWQIRHRLAPEYNLAPFYPLYNILADKLGWSRVSVPRITNFCVARFRQGIDPHPRYNPVAYFNVYKMRSIFYLIVIYFLRRYTFPILKLITYYTYTYINPSVGNMCSTVMISPPPCVPERIIVNESEVGEVLYQEKLAEEGYDVVSPKRRCHGCITWTCEMHTQPIIFPGLILADKALCSLARKSHSILVTKPSKVHAHIYDTAYGLSFRPFSHRMINGEPLSCIKVDERSDMEVYRIVFTNTPNIMERPLKDRVVGSSNFILGNDRVTMTHPHLESVPVDLLSSVAARMATSDAEPAKLQDQCLAFLRSKCTANNIKLTDYTAWTILLTDLTARSSAKASTSIRTNMPFNPSVAQYLTYYFNYYMDRYNPLSHVPKSTEWDFRDIQVPTYEVFTKAENVAYGEERLPESAQPFQDVRPTVTPSVDGESIGCPGADIDQCSDFHGEESPTTSADAEPNFDRPEMPTDGAELDSSITVRDDVSEHATGTLNVTGVREHHIEYSFPNCKVGCVNPTSSDVQQSLATTIGDADLLLMPRANILPSGKLVYKWVLLLSGNGSHDHTALQLCFECATQLAQRELASGRSPHSSLLQTHYKRRVVSCKVNTEIIRRDGSVAPNGIDFLGESNLSDGEGPEANTNGVRGLGDEVPNREKESTKRRKKQGGKRRTTLRQRCNRQDFH